MGLGGNFTAPSPPTDLNLTAKPFEIGLHAGHPVSRDSVTPRIDAWHLGNGGFTIQFGTLVHPFGNPFNLHSCHDLELGLGSPGALQHQR